mgnify:CR=1 FL=1
MGTNKRTRQKVVKVYSCFNEGPVGVESEIEISITPGIPTFEVIGLCDSVIKESRGRIQAALISSGYSMPRGHIVVSISPAYLRKSGSSFDLPIAIGILLASSQIEVDREKKIYAEGELSLIGYVNGAPGAAARLKAASVERSKYDYFIIPKAEVNAAAVAELKGVSVSHVTDLLDVFNDVTQEEVFEGNPISIEDDDGLDFSSVKGQPKAMRALLIAACGFHSVLLLGSPGCGKTTAANVIRGIMPPLNKTEMADVYTVKESAGITTDEGRPLSLSAKRPIRRIYPGMSVSRVLGSVKNSTPGELVLANHGIVLADEICEFPIGIIDCLRLPIEEHVIRMQKYGKDFEFPAEFLFVGLGNPCRCGKFYEVGNKCICSPQIRRRYMNKISGPFADRIDLFTEMRSLQGNEMFELTARDEKQNLMYKEIVRNTWEIQKNRYRGMSYKFNGNVNTIDAELIRASSDVQKYAAEVSEKSGFSARGYTKLLRVGRTIADMNEQVDISISDIAEAAMYRYRV